MGNTTLDVSLEQLDIALTRVLAEIGTLNSGVLIEGLDIIGSHSGRVVFGVRFLDERWDRQATYGHTPSAAFRGLVSLLTTGGK